MSLTALRAPSLLKSWGGAARAEYLADRLMPSKACRYRLILSASASSRFRMCSTGSTFAIRRNLLASRW